MLIIVKECIAMESQIGTAPVFFNSSTNEYVHKSFGGLS